MAPSTPLRFREGTYRVTPDGPIPFGKVHFLRHITEEDEKLCQEDLVCDASTIQLIVEEDLVVCEVFHAPTNDLMLIVGTEEVYSDESERAIAGIDQFITWLESAAIMPLEVATIKPSEKVGTAATSRAIAL